MRLELDAGNTRIKWRLYDGQEYVMSGHDLKTHWVQTPNWGQQIELVWMSSVHPSQTLWVQQHFNEVLLAETLKEQNGLSNSYQDVSRMGVDRWLAMLSAWCRNPGQINIVIDAGTALTVDIVRADGTHLGGYICPGLSLMKSALLGQTQRVLADADWQHARDPGTSTQACVDHGLLDMAVSWLESILCQYQHQANKVWLTGGDSATLAKFLRESVVCDADLVLNGLNEYFGN